MVDLTFTGPDPDAWQYWVSHKTFHSRNTSQIGKQTNKQGCSDGRQIQFFSNRLFLGRLSALLTASDQIIFVCPVYATYPYGLLWRFLNFF